MSSQGSHGRGTRGHRGMPRGESSSMRSIPILEKSETVDTLTAEMRSQVESIGDDPVS